MSDAQHYERDQIDRRFVAAALPLLAPYVARAGVLNLGVGYGVWDEHLAGACADVTSLDINPEIIDQARRRFPQIAYEVADVFAYRPGRTFRTIVCSHFLEHVDHPVGLLRLLRGWLAPQGTLLVVVPNAHSLHRRIGVAMGMLESVYDLNASDVVLGHRRVYDAATLRADLYAGGFTINLLRSITLKPVANAMFEALGPAYLEACLDARHDWGELGGQLLAVAV